MNLSDCCNYMVEAVFDTVYSKIFYTCQKCKNACSIHAGVDPATITSSLSQPVSSPAPSQKIEVKKELDVDSYNRGIDVATALVKEYVEKGFEAKTILDYLPVLKILKP